MPNITTISDGGSDPNTPSIKQMRDSQQRGAEGIGTSTHSFAEKQAIRNHGTGLGEGSDETFPEAANYKKSSDEGPKLPWE